MSSLDQYLPTTSNQTNSLDAYLPEEKKKKVSKLDQYLPTKVTPKQPEEGELPFLVKLGTSLQRGFEAPFSRALGVEQPAIGQPDLDEEIRGRGVSKMPFQSIAKIATGKDLGEITGSKGLIDRKMEQITNQAIEENKPLTERTIHKNMLPAFLAEKGIELADLTPMDIVAGMAIGVGGKALGKTKLGQIVKRVPIGKKFFGRAKDLSRLDKTLKTSAITSGRSPIRGDIESTSTVIAKSLDKMKDKSGILKDQFETEIIDKHAPIRHFVNMTEEAVGKPVAFADDPYQAVRLYAGVSGKINQRLKPVGQILKPVRKNLDDVATIMKNQRFIERAGRGFENPGGVNAKMAQANLDGLRGKLGNAKYDDLVSRVGNIRSQLWDKLLLETRESGVISQEAFEAIQKNNQFYTPFDVMEHLADGMKGMPTGKNSFSLASQSVIKPLKGSTKDIDDPFNSMIRQVFKTVQTNERNKVAKKLVDLRHMGPEMEEFIKPLKTGDAVPKGFDKVSALFDGKKQSFAIPTDIAEAMKGMNTETADLLTRMASKGTQALRMGATTLNLPFAISNLVRDNQTAALVSKVGWNPKSWAKGVFSALRKDAWVDAFEESGASMSGFFSGRNAKIPTSIQEIIGPSISKKVANVFNPVKVIDAITSKSELTTRVGVFRRGVEKGLTQEAAAMNARRLL